MVKVLIAPAMLAILLTASTAAAARETVTGVIEKLDSYAVGDGPGPLYKTIWLRVIRIPWAHPYHFDKDTEVLAGELKEGMRVTVDFEEETADLVIRSIRAAN
jgi:hypothetical protein